MCCHNSTPATAIRNAIGGATGTLIGAVDWHYLNSQTTAGRSFANKAAVTAGVNSLADSLSMGTEERAELLTATGNSNVTERMLAHPVSEVLWKKIGRSARGRGRDGDERAESDSSATRLRSVSPSRNGSFPRSRLGDSNSGPTHYECVALPLS
jgi:hypothetical protein